ncbi:DUF6044 family protein [Oceaniglobus trochenteri]|uniref:DUF6044 family protein n=1 Tax=Oceaniglobus trochenteri TaxID=2763260 RepID=UPI001CFFD8F2|nr:DUF6044 family protein [Oceaniglobus trochenteri]
MDRGRLWFAALLAVKYLVPLAVLGGIYASAHDNLDGDVVYSIVIGRFLAGDAQAFDVFLNGAVDWTYFMRSFQPISLIYAALPPQPAYALTEAFFLSLAFFGMRRLIRDLVPGQGDTLIPLVYAFGLSFTSFGLGLAAAPWVVWLAGRDKAFGGWAAVAVFLIGLNSALALHSLFLPVGTLVCLLVLGCGVRWGRFILLHGVLYAGAALGSVGVLYNLAFGPPSHRSTWPAPEPEGMVGQFIQSTLGDLFFMSSQYHATVVPALYTAFVIGAGLWAARARAWPVLALIAGGAALGAFQPAYDALMVGPLGSVQFDRIGLYAPLACLTLAAVVGARWLRWPLGISLAMFVLAGIGLSPYTLKPLLPPTAREVLREVKASGDYAALFGPRAIGGIDLSRDALFHAATVAGYYRAPEYACLKTVIGDARVLSMGPDPMIAPANDIAALEGYHNLYPLAYRQAFRPVIAAKLAADADLRAYYDDWGNRVYAFGDRARDVAPDYAAAARLGADFVIADRALDDPALADATPDCAGDLRLYRIVSR